MPSISVWRSIAVTVSIDRLSCESWNHQLLIEQFSDSVDPTKWQRGHALLTLRDASDIPVGDTGDVTSRHPSAQRAANGPVNTPLENITSTPLGERALSLCLPKNPFKLTWKTHDRNPLQDTLADAPFFHRSSPDRRICLPRPLQAIAIVNPDLAAHGLESRRDLIRSVSGSAPSPTPCSSAPRASSPIPDGHDRWTIFPAGPDQRARDTEFAAFVPHPRRKVSGITWIDGKVEHGASGPESRRGYGTRLPEFQSSVDGWKAQVQAEARAQATSGGHVRAKM
ncbi:hypothetical protein E4U41_003968 [Claviceps citrina]|nr:hypothetical protein E4U41_003968 [Claviceps citrina]